MDLARFNPHLSTFRRIVRFPGSASVARFRIGHGLPCVAYPGGYSTADECWWAAWGNAHRRAGPDHQGARPDSRPRMHRIAECPDAVSKLGKVPAYPEKDRKRAPYSPDKPVLLRPERPATHQHDKRQPNGRTSATAADYPWSALRLVFPLRAPAAWRLCS